MKISRMLLPALATFAAVAPIAPSAALGSEADRSLTMAAARAAARPIAWEVARRNHSVNSVKVERCRRRTAARINCMALDRGSTSISRTLCKVWVQVRLAHGRPRASLTLVSCKNERLPLLRAASALAAMRPLAEELGGKDVSVASLGRPSRVEFLALAAWTRPATGVPAETELCGANLHARLLDTGEVSIAAAEPFCVLPR